DLISNWRALLPDAAIPGVAEALMRGGFENRNFPILLTSGVRVFGAARLTFSDDTFVTVAIPEIPAHSGDYVVVDLASNIHYGTDGLNPFSAEALRTGVVLPVGPTRASIFVAIPRNLYERRELAVSASSRPLPDRK